MNFLNRVTDFTKERFILEVKLTMEEQVVQTSGQRRVELDYNAVLGQFIASSDAIGDSITSTRPVCLFGAIFCLLLNVLDSGCSRQVQVVLSVSSTETNANSL